MSDWFLEYEKGYLLSYINRKRLENRNYTIVRNFDDLDRLLKKEKKAGETELEMVKRLINEMRKGRRF